GQRDAGRDGKPRRTVQKVGRRTVEKDSGAPAPPRGLLRKRGGGVDVADPNVDAAGGPGVRQRLAAAGKPEKPHPPREGVSALRPSPFALRLLCHRSFSVDSPSTANRIATIQNRMMTRDSGHPASSKW